jgi:hypothetical protein
MNSLVPPPKSVESGSRSRRALSAGLIALITSVGSELAHAQSDANDGGSELSLHVGYLLPNQIPGVTEIMPVFGARYATPFIGTMGEFAFGNTHAEGVDFTTFSAGARIDLPEIDQFVGFVTAGLDLHWYIPNGATKRQTDNGFHLGTGLMMRAVESLWLRSDIKLMAQPGTALYIGFGVTFRPESSTGQ